MCTNNISNSREIIDQLSATVDPAAANRFRLGYKNAVKLARNQARLQFLLQHRRRGIYPRFIYDKLTIFNSQTMQITDRHPTSHSDINKAKRSFLRQFLNVEISLCSRQNKTLRSRHDELLTALRDPMYGDLSTIATTHLHDRYTLELNKSRERQNKKLERNYQTSMNDTLRLNEDFCANLSSKQIPPEVTRLMGLGKKFALPVSRNATPLMDMLVDTDSIIRTCSESDQDTLRALVTHDFLDHIKRPENHTRTEKLIKHLEDVTRKFLKDNPDVYVVQSDKGQKTVIIDKVDYEEKMRQHLSDTNTYELLPPGTTNLTEKVRRLMNDLLNDIFARGQIEAHVKNRLTAETCTPPRIYGTVKLHKQGMPIRPVMSTVNSPTYNLSKYLNEILSNLEKHPVDVKNSSEVREKLNNLLIDDDEEMVSFDVVSLYTSIPQEEAINATMRRWPEIRKHTKISKPHFRMLLELCICHSGYFLYEDRYYRQKEGLAMGNSLSGTVATYVLNDLLDDVFEIAPPRFLVKYVDDTFCILKKNNTNEVLRRLNCSHDRIKFTIEHESQARIPFLDLMVIREDGHIITDWYRKEMASGRLLNFFSAHPYRMKVGVAKSFARNVISLSDERFHANNFKKIESTLANNNFPATTIKRVINDIKYHRQPSTNTRDDSGTKSFRKLPYVPILSDKINSSVQKINPSIHLGMQPPRKLQQLFTQLKSKVPNTRQGICYRVKCLGDGQAPCNRTYVGETKHGVGNDGTPCQRMRQHTYDYNAAKRQHVQKMEAREECYMKLRTRSKREELEALQQAHKAEDEDMKFKTAAVEHAIKAGHVFDFAHPEVLHHEPATWRRRALESLYIYREKERSVNFKLDTKYVHKSTKQIINAETHRRHQCDSRPRPAHTASHRAEHNVSE